MLLCYVFYLLSQNKLHTIRMKVTLDSLPQMGFCTLCIFILVTLKKRRTTKPGRNLLCWSGGQQLLTSKLPIASHCESKIMYQPKNIAENLRQLHHLYRLFDFFL